MMEQRLMSVQDVAERLGKSIPWARLAARQGTIPAQKVGRDWVFFEAAVEAYAAAQGKKGGE